MDENTTNELIRLPEQIREIKEEPAESMTTSEGEQEENVCEKLQEKSMLSINAEKMTTSIDSEVEHEENGCEKLPDEKSMSINAEKMTTSIDSEVEHEENVCEKLPEEKSMSINGEASSIQKETIEILNVQLVAHSQDHFNVSEKMHDIVSDKDILASEQEKLYPVRSSVESYIDTLEANEMETSKVSVPFTLLKQHEKNSDETITKALEPLDATVNNSLSLLTQYHSDDDSNSVIEVPTVSAQDYRNNVVEVNTDSDSDDSTDSSDVECIADLRKTIEKRIEIVDDEENEHDNEGSTGNTGNKRNNTKMKVKGEMGLEDLPPIQDLQITVPEDECIEFGKIHSIVDQLVLVSPLPNSILLDLETVIFLEKGQKVLGAVFDVLGQVADPLYCVRFNTNKEIKEKQINIGDLAYIAPKTQYTQYVILSNLMKLKGSDASWENDLEPPPRFLEYSDDEQEQLARRQLRNKDRPLDDEDPSKRHRPNDSTSNISQNSIAHYRNIQNEQRNNRGVPAGQSNDNMRPLHGGHYRYQQHMSNQYRNSWHSNYYPQSFPRPTGTYGMHSAHNQTPPHAYPQNPHDTPLVHNMPYPPHQPIQYGAPPMFHQHGPQLMHTAFGIRPPTLHGPSQSSHHHYNSTPPPNSGSQ